LRLAARTLERHHRESRNLGRRLRAQIAPNEIETEIEPLYLSGGFGVWELALPAAIGGLAWFGLKSYRCIGIAWLLHSAWDLPHHFFGNPIWPFMPTSSFGCFVFDAIIGVWFLLNAPALFRPTAMFSPRRRRLGSQ
jgi:hypothetical protein